MLPIWSAAGLRLVAPEACPEHVEGALLQEVEQDTRLIAACITGKSVMESGIVGLCSCCFKISGGVENAPD